MISLENYGFRRASFLSIMDQNTLLMHREVVVIFDIKGVHPGIYLPAGYIDNCQTLTAFVRQYLTYYEVAIH